MHFFPLEYKEENQLTGTIPVGFSTNNLLEYIDLCK